MYAVIRTGGKQYKVAPQDVLQIEKIDAAAGDTITFSDVLMIAGEGEPKIGVPAIDGALVSAEVVEQGRGPKIIIFKKKRRQNYRRKNGHRQSLTTIKILGISADGKKIEKSDAAPAHASVETEAKPHAAKAKVAETGAGEGASAEAAPKKAAAKKAPKSE